MRRVQGAATARGRVGRGMGGWSSSGSCRRRPPPPPANRRAARPCKLLPRCVTMRDAPSGARRLPRTPARCQRAWAGTAASNAARAASSRAARMVDVSSGVKPGADGSRCPASNSGRQRGTAGAPAAVAARGSPFLCSPAALTHWLLAYIEIWLQMQKAWPHFPPTDPAAQASECPAGIGAATSLPPSLLLLLLLLPLRGAA